MPTALSTTKRKFHKLLDSISNASSTSLATQHDKFASSTTTLPAALDPPNKRSRLERPISAYAPRSAGMIPPEKNIGTRPPTVAATQTKPSLSITGEHKSPPNFAPWDRGQFLERLKTYRHVDKWMGKPEKINEVEWAKRGWSCVGKERVGCVGGCGKEVFIKLEEEETEEENEDGEGGDDGNQNEDDDDDEDWRDKAQEQLVEKYTEMISSAHEGGCLWRRRGCDDTIQRLPLVHQVTALDGLCSRYRSLLAMASDLPSSLTTPDSLDAAKTVRQAAALLQSPSSPTSTTDPSATSPPSPSHLTDTNTPALLLALFGWQAEENHISGLATCTACFRRLGLWLFKSSDSSMDRLDVISEHRGYCPWINVLSQNGGNRRSSLDGLAGWEVLLRAVNARAGKVPKVEGSEGRVGSGEGDGDEASDGGSFVESTVVAEEDDKLRDERDRERWAKLKRLKEVFHVKKRGKGRENGDAGTSRTAA